MKQPLTAVNKKIISDISNTHTKMNKENFWEHKQNFTEKFNLF